MENLESLGRLAGSHLTCDWAVWSALRHVSDYFFRIYHSERGISVPGTTQVVVSPDQSPFSWQVRCAEPVIP